MGNQQSTAQKRQIWQDPTGGYCAVCDKHHETIWLVGNYRTGVETYCTEHLPERRTK